jgi:hypothetical protein
MIHNNATITKEASEDCKELEAVTKARQVEDNLVKYLGVFYARYVDHYGADICKDLRLAFRNALTEVQTLIGTTRFDQELGADAFRLIEEENLYDFIHMVEDVCLCAIGVETAGEHEDVVM